MFREVRIYNYFGLIFLLYFMLSCGVPRNMRNRMTFCYTGIPTGIDSLLNTKGYFKMKQIWDREERYTTKGQWKHKIDTLFTNLMFYNDGIFVKDFHNYDQEIPEYFNEIVAKTASGKKHTFHNWGSWGCYIISGDTIKAQYVNHPGLNNICMAFETWYKIIDRNTIKVIANKKLYYDKLNQDKSEMNLHFVDEKNCDTAVFIPLESLPNSDCWLKKKKWFWCSDKIKK